jgi:hypothetical protein
LEQKISIGELHLLHTLVTLSYTISFHRHSPLSSPLAGGYKNFGFGRL